MSSPSQSQADQSLSNTNYHFHVVSQSSVYSDAAQQQRLEKLVTNAKALHESSLVSARQTVRDLESLLQSASTIHDLHDAINNAYKAQLKVTQTNRLVNYMISDVDVSLRSYHTSELQILKIEADYYSNVARLDYKVEAVFQRNLHVRNTLTNVYRSRLDIRFEDEANTDNLNLDHSTDPQDSDVQLPNVPDTVDENLKKTNDELVAPQDDSTDVEDESMMLMYGCC